MRIAIVYSTYKGRGMIRLAQKLMDGLSAMGHQAELIPDDKGGRRNLFPFGHIFFGTQVISVFSGKIPVRLAQFINQCSGLQGKRVTAFAPHRLFGKRKTLLRLMSLLEKQGCLVVNFATFRNNQEALNLGKRLGYDGRYV